MQTLIFCTIKLNRKYSIRFCIKYHVSNLFCLERYGYANNCASIYPTHKHAIPLTAIRDYYNHPFRCPTSFSSESATVCVFLLIQTAQLMHSDCAQRRQHPIVECWSPAYIRRIKFHISVLAQTYILPENNRQSQKQRISTKKK